MTEYNNEYNLSNFPGNEGSKLEILSPYLRKFVARDILIWVRVLVPNTVYIERGKCFDILG